jgi:hypothetical protein
MDSKQLYTQPVVLEEGVDALRRASLGATVKP